MREDERCGFKMSDGHTCGYRRGHSDKHSSRQNAERIAESLHEWARTDGAEIMARIARRSELVSS